MTSFSKTCSASGLFRRAYSASKPFSRLASDTLMLPNFPRHRWCEASLKPCLRQVSLICRSVSASRKKPMICSLVKRFFTLNHLVIENWTPSRFATQYRGTSPTHHSFRGPTWPPRMGKRLRGMLCRLALQILISPHTRGSKYSVPCC